MQTGIQLILEIWPGVGQMIQSYRFLTSLFPQLVGFQLEDETYGLTMGTCCAPDSSVLAWIWFRSSSAMQAFFIHIWTQPLHWNIQNWNDPSSMCVLHNCPITCTDTWSQSLSSWTAFKQSPRTSYPNILCRGRTLLIFRFICLHSTKRVHQLRGNFWKSNSWFSWNEKQDIQLHPPCQEYFEVT